MSKRDWRAGLAALFPDARFDEPLSRYTTFRIGGPADAFVTARGHRDLSRLLAFCRAKRVPLFPLGFGSNLLVLDGGIRGVVVRLAGEFGRVEFPGGTRVRAGAGVRVPHLALCCAERGLAGTEPLVGVPGTVGGALVMNAGTRDGEIGALVRWVECLGPRSLKVVRVPRSRLRFAYRSSNLGRRLVLGAELELRPGDKVDIIDRVKKFQAVRLKTQPVHSFNVGSVFKNPPGRFVARLVEEAGLKGAVSGGARISPKHANFIENFDRARARDVLRLVETARGAVRARTGIELELEMKVVGES